MQKKKRERSVKHRLHDAGGKTDGKSTFFLGNFGEKHDFKNSCFPAPKREISFFLQEFWKTLEKAPIKPWSSCPPSDFSAVSDRVVFTLKII